MEIDVGNHISYSQTSKGVWKCDGFTVYASSIFDAIAISDRAIDDINKTLKQINKKALEEINKVPMKTNTENPKIKRK